MMGWACLRQTSTAVNDEDEDSHGSGPADQQLEPHVNDHLGNLLHERHAPQLAEDLHANSPQSKKLRSSLS